MRCKECGKENIIKASYCSHCGNEFTEEEKDEAFLKTFVGKITKLEEIIETLKGYATLEVITGHPVFKIGLLLAILVFGILIGRSNGSNMTILESNQYSVSYNTKLEEYYVETQEETIVLNLYFPRTVEGIYLSAGENEVYYSTNDIIELNVDRKIRYQVRADYGDDEELITLYVLKG